MFERFTREARETIVLATEEARRMGHDYVGTEHILLALFGSSDPAPGRALASLGLTAKRVSAEIRRLVGEGEQSDAEEIPFTSRAKAALDLADRESPGEEPVGPGHLLLGVAREGQGVGARILREADADLEQMRRELSG